MAHKRTKICQSIGDTELIDLPDIALDKIMTCLSLHNAARTSVLSKAWRYKWASLRRLIFDETFFDESSRKSQSGILLMVYEILLPHRGPIEKFVLSIPGVESCREIDHFIVLLSRNGVKHIVLRIWEGHERYKLTSSLFACVELEYLELDKCLIKPPLEFKGFNKLCCLKISDFIMAADVFSRLISSCPLLEELTAESTITINDCIEIDAVKLKSLHFSGRFVAVVLKSTPSLTNCVFCLEEYDHYIGDLEVSNVFQSLDSLNAVEFLHLENYYVAYQPVGNIPCKITTSFDQLRILNLCRISFGHLREISNVICLLRSSPNLEKLIIEVCAREYDETVNDLCDLFSVEEQSHFSLGQLREVEMHCISERKPELAFVKFLLAVSPKLEVITIWPDDDFVSDKGFEILREVAYFCRRSPLAELKLRNYVRPRA